MENSEKMTEKQLRYKKLLGAGLIVAAALYCIPGLREALRSGVDFLTHEWRNWHAGQQK